MYGSELTEGNNNNGTYRNCAHQDGQGDHIALVLPVDNMTGRTATTHKRVGIRLLTVAARSCDGFEHPRILTCLQSIAIDPHQNHSADKNTVGCVIYNAPFHPNQGNRVGNKLPTLQRTLHLQTFAQLAHSLQTKIHHTITHVQIQAATDTRITVVFHCRNL